MISMISFVSLSSYSRNGKCI